MTQSLLTGAAIAAERSQVVIAQETFGGTKPDYIKMDSPLAQELHAKHPNAVWIVKHDGTVIGFGSRCKLRPYKEGGEDPCPKGMTGHHVVPDRCFREGKRRKSERILADKEGLVMCLDGKDRDPNLQHGKAHEATDNAISNLADADGLAPLNDVENEAAAGVAEVSGCNKDDIKKQLEEYHKEKGLSLDTKVRASLNGQSKNGKLKLDAELKDKFKERITRKSTEFGNFGTF